MRRVRRVALACSAFAGLAATHTAAQSAAAAGPPAYALSWVRAEGAEACPTGRVLATEVERRLGRAVFDVAADRSFEVEVTRFGNTYRSDVYVRDAAGTAIGHRSLQSDEPGCSALVNATALAIALVIDPEAAARGPAAKPASAAFAPPTEPAPAVAPPAAPPTAPAALPAPQSEMRLSAPPPRPLLTLSARAQVTGGLVAATSPGFELSFTARPGARWGFAIGASYALSQTASVGIGALDFGLTRASALVTFDVAQSKHVRLVLLGGPTLGAFHLAVRKPAPVTSPGDYWFVAAELGGNLQVAVTDGSFVELGGALLAPLLRQQFLVRRQTEPVWSEPALAGLAFLGVGALFP